MDGIILRPDLQKRLQGITIATARARQYGTNYRNFMLYGPPGTGKTMFAKKLALQVCAACCVLSIVMVCRVDWTMPFLLAETWGLWVAMLSGRFTACLTGPRPAVAGMLVSCIVLYPPSHCAAC